MFDFNTFREFFETDWCKVSVILIFLPIFIVNKMVKFYQLSVLTGDSITHLLFHNLFKKGFKINISGVVGGDKLNLPKILYEISSKIFPFYEYNKRINLISYSNLLILTLIELLIFISVYINRGLIEALLSLLCVGLIPSIAITSWSEKGSYSKFSERFWALIFNGGAVYFTLEISHEAYDNYTVIISSFFLIGSVYLGKFSRQVVIFWILFLLIFSFEVIILIPIISMCIFIFMDKSLRREMISQLIYLKNYKLYQSINFEVSELTLNRYFLFKRLAKKKMIRIYIRLFLHSGVGILIMLPTVFILLLGKNQEFELLTYGSLFVAIVTTTHWLYFIGSGDRYIYNLVTIPAFASVYTYGSSIPLIYINGLIVILSLIINIKSVYKNSKSVKNKCIAYLTLSKYIGKDNTVFFDHYKDGEIFQLINDLYSEKFKNSTSRTYLWDKTSKEIFSSYPKISFELENLSKFSVDYVITNRFHQQDELIFVDDVNGYKLYKVSMNKCSS